MIGLSKNDIKLIKKSFNYLKPYKLNFLICLFTLIFSIIIRLFNPLLLGHLIENISKRADIINIYENIIYIILLNIIEIITAYFYQRSSSKLTNNIILDLKLNMYSKILNFCMKDFDKTTTGEFISRMEGDVSTLTNIITSSILKIVVNILTVCIVGVAVLKINIIMSIIVMISFPFSYYIFKIYGIKLRKENEEYKKINDRYFSILEQSLNGIKYIKINGIKNQNYKYYNSISNKIKDKSLYIEFLNIVSNIVSTSINQLSHIIVIIIGIFFIYKGTIELYMFIAFISYSSQFSNALNELTTMNSTIQQTLVSLERIFGIIDNLAFSNERFGNKYVDCIEGNISFKNVEFSYGEENVIGNLSFNIKSKTLTTIIGKSGCGKSTILSLICGLYKVDKGAICIDGINLSNFNEETLRNNICLVPQNPFLFNLSIKDNFRLLNKDITDKEIEDACKKAYIYEYIMNLDDGFNTIIEDSCSNLSYGQKQRMSLAIAISKNTPIILLDEISAGLDIKSQKYILEILLELSVDKTVVLVTHDLKIISESNHILNMDNISFIT